MYLEDARPANDRTAEVPREMKLSVMRWDRYPEVPPPPSASLDARGGVGAAGGIFGASGDRGGAEETAGNPWQDDQ